MSELESLHARQKVIILGTCNTIGCKDCDLKWDGGCASSELQEKIMDIEMAEFQSETNKALIPSDKGKDFKCTRQTKPDLDVWHINGLMCIAHPEDPIYITKEQAMKFFDLKE